jgi:short-subunit dehydrogenase
MSAASPETVLVTGASSGIGWELAKCFAADGCRLILVARNQDALEKLAGELRLENKIEVVVFPADLSLPETPNRIFQELSSRKIAVDVLVNNAGFGLMGPFVKLPLTRQLEIIQVNITALTALTGLLLPGIIERQRGGILNVGSVAGFVPGPNMAVYYATKAFVLSFTEALAEELSGSGLAISVLCPGPTESNFGNVARGGRQRKIKTRKMTSLAVAKIGHRAFRQGKNIIVTGLQNKIAAQLPRIMPRAAVRRIVKFYNRNDVQPGEIK